MRNRPARRGPLRRRRHPGRHHLPAHRELVGGVAPDRPAGADGGGAPVDRDGLGQAPGPPPRPGAGPRRRREAARRARHPLRRVLGTAHAAAPGRRTCCGPAPSGGCGSCWPPPPRNPRWPRCVGALAADDVIDTVTSSADAQQSKPAPDILVAALEQSGLAAERVVFVGDSVWDVVAAGKLNIPCVGPHLRRHQPRRARRRGRGGGVRRPGRAAARVGGLAARPGPR